MTDSSYTLVKLVAASICLLILGMSVLKQCKVLRISKAHTLLHVYQHRVSNILVFLMALINSLTIFWVVFGISHVSSSVFKSLSSVSKTLVVFDLVLTIIVGIHLYAKIEWGSNSNKSLGFILVFALLIMMFAQAAFPILDYAFFNKLTTTLKNLPLVQQLALFGCLPFKTVLFFRALEQVTQHLITTGASHPEQQQQQQPADNQYQLPADDDQKVKDTSIIGNDGEVEPTQNSLKLNACFTLLFVIFLAVFVLIEMLTALSDREKCHFMKFDPLCYSFIFMDISQMLIIIGALYFLHSYINKYQIALNLVGLLKANPGFAIACIGVLVFDIAAASEKYDLISANKSSSKLSSYSPFFGVLVRMVFRVVQVVFICFINARVMGVLDCAAIATAHTQTFLKFIAIANACFLFHYFLHEILHFGHLSTHQVKSSDLSAVILAVCTFFNIEFFVASMERIKYTCQTVETQVEEMLEQSDETMVVLDKENQPAVAKSSFSPPSKNPPLPKELEHRDLVQEELDASKNAAVAGNKRDQDDIAGGSRARITRGGFPEFYNPQRMPRRQQVPQYYRGY